MTPSRVRRALRTAEWWHGKPPLMMAVAYWTLLDADALVPAGTAVETAALFLTAAFGIGAFGFVLNDLGDREPDQEAGKPNAAATLGTAPVVALLLGLIVVSAVPWVVLQPGAAVVALLVCELVLFALYALPPARLKARGLAGCLADATYAQAIPVAVAVLLFGRLEDGDPAWWLLALATAWAGTSGLRLYLEHLLEDAGEDERAGDRTFVLRHGWARSLRLLVRAVLPLELVLLAAVLLAMAVVAPLVAVGVLAVLVWRGRRRPAHLMGDRLGDLPPLVRHGLVADRLVAPLVTLWLPLLLVTSLVLRDVEYLLLLALHLLVFPRTARALTALPRRPGRALG